MYSVKTNESTILKNITVAQKSTCRPCTILPKIQGIALTSYNVSFCQSGSLPHAKGAHSQRQNTFLTSKCTMCHMWSTGVYMDAILTTVQKQICRVMATCILSSTDSTDTCTSAFLSCHPPTRGTGLKIPAPQASTPPAWLTLQDSTQAAAVEQVDLGQRTYIHVGFHTHFRR